MLMVGCKSKVHMITALTSGAFLIMRINFQQALQLYIKKSFPRPKTLAFYIAGEAFPKSFRRLLVFREMCILAL